MTTGIQFLPQEDGTVRYRVSCPVHSLDRVVDTPAHAANLEALHNRVDHADDSDPVHVDLTAAARAVIDPVPLRSWDQGAYTGAEAVWEALTGLTGDDALAYAREVAAADPPITASVPPF